MSPKQTQSSDHRKPCKKAVKRAEDVAPMESEGLQKLWRKIYLGIDSEIHCLRYDQRMYGKGKLTDKEMSGVLTHHLNNTLARMIGLMGLHEMAFHSQMHFWEQSKDLTKIREEAEGLNKDFGKHKVLLDALHEEFDKTAEAVRHGREIYK